MLILLAKSEGMENVWFAKEEWEVEAEVKVDT